MKHHMKKIVWIGLIIVLGLIFTVLKFESNHVNTLPHAEIGMGTSTVTTADRNVQVGTANPLDDSLRKKENQNLTHSSSGRKAKRAS